MFQRYLAAIITFNKHYKNLLRIATEYFYTRQELKRSTYVIQLFLKLLHGKEILF